MKLKVKKEISKYESRIDKHEKEIQILNADIKCSNDKIAELMLPELEKKYLGKCYKFKNSYGGDKNEFWWSYSKIVRVLGEDRFESISFQNDSLGKIEINIRDNFYLDESWIKISLGEYNKAEQKLFYNIKEILRNENIKK